MNPLPYPELLMLLRTGFPTLNEANSRLTSPASEDYNCIAWAAEDIERWWWPDPQGQSYWPPNAPRAESIEAFELAFRGLGYAQRADASSEPNKQKVAVFVDAQGKPTHAARQLPNGWWTSKMGRQIDIEHELLAIEGPQYGEVAVVVARTIAAP